MVHILGKFPLTFTSWRYRAPFSILVAVSGILLHSFVSMESQVNQTDSLDERLLSQAALNNASDVLRSLCVKFSPTFVAVERRDARLDECLESLLSKLNNAGYGAAQAENRLEIGTDSDDSSSLSALAERHRLRRRTLLQHGSLLELLELPALMDACLRAGLYDEALAVAAFGNALERRHSTSILMPAPPPAPPPPLRSWSASNASLLTDVAGPTNEADCNLGRFLVPGMMVYEAAEYSYSPSTSASSCCCSSILDTKYADRRYTYHELEGQTTRGE